MCSETYIGGLKLTTVAVLFTPREWTRAMNQRLYLKTRNQEGRVAVSSEF